MGSRASRWVSRISGLLLLCSIAGGCRPNLATERGRYDYLQGHIYEALKAKLGCSSARISFVRTETRNGAEYDNYAAEGCGLTSDLVTHISQEGNLII
ncbi:MAG: hypothetical protein R3B06_03895 [Kofleriaceae bacterium]